MPRLRSAVSGHVPVQLEPLSQMIRRAGVRAHSVIGDYKNICSVCRFEKSANSLIKLAIDLQKSILAGRSRSIIPKIVSSPVTRGVDGHEKIRRSRLDQILGDRRLNLDQVHP